MTYEELATLDDATLLDELQTDPTITRDKSGNIDYYEGSHAILTDTDRADFSQDIYEKDAKGRIVNDSDGKPKVSGTRTVTRARIVLSHPKQIITTKIAMIAGNGVDINDDDGISPDTFKLFNTQFYDKLKVPSVMKDVIRTTGIETNCALIFFFKNGDNAQGLKCKLLSYANGDTIYPYFDSDGDLIAFTRVFTDTSVVDGSVTGVEVIQAYFADKVIISTDGVIETVPNPYGKIPVVYFDQVYPEFKDAKDSITKQEYATSQLYEVNRRIGSPPILLTGDVVDMGDPSVDQKVFKAGTAFGTDGGAINGDVKLIESTTAPESIKLQMELLDKNIERASWMDLSKLLEFASGVGTSGFAMTVAMTQAFATRAAQISIYEDGMTRIISIMKTMLATTSGGAAFETLSVGFTFKPLLPDDLATMTTIIAEAKQAGITSEEQGVRLWPLNEDPAMVLQEINTLTGASAE